MEISFEEGMKIAKRSLKESWDLFIELLKNKNVDESVIQRLGKMPKLKMNKMKSKDIAGLYWHPTILYPSKNVSYIPKWNDTIELNSRYLKSNNPTLCLWNVTKHELGHCINYRLNKRINHDKAFRAIVKAIGGDPSTYHPWIVITPGETSYILKCECGETFTFYQDRYEKSMEGKLACRKCNKNLIDAKIIEILK